MVFTRPVPQLAGPHHVALLVADLEAIAAFYEGVLGLPRLSVHRHGDGALRSIWLDLSGTVLMLEGADPGTVRRGPKGGGWHLLALRIEADSREAWRTHLEARGVPVVHSTPTSLYLDDPEGNRLCLSHYPVPTS